jgi:predicted DNA-binding protein (MmcQ/YjbR family)
MDVEWIRRVCIGLPHATEQVLWGADLVFKIGGKMFAAAPMEPAPVCLSFKCTPERFAELTERPGVIPAPYSARAHWVALENEDALPRAEIRELLRESYGLVLARLPKKRQAKLQAGRKRKKGQAE